MTLREEATEFLNAPYSFPIDIPAALSLLGRLISENNSQHDEIIATVAKMNEFHTEKTRYKTALKLIASPDVTPEMAKRAYEGISMDRIYEDIAKEALEPESATG